MKNWLVIGILIAFVYAFYRSGNTVTGKLLQMSNRPENSPAFFFSNPPNTEDESVIPGTGVVATNAAGGFGGVGQGIDSPTGGSMGDSGRAPIMT
jgi:hypothetical protein